MQIRWAYKYPKHRIKTQTTKLKHLEERLDSYIFILTQKQNK